MYYNIQEKTFFVCDFLQVSKPFVVGGKLRPIKLNKGTIQPGKFVRVSGWGFTKERGYRSRILQQVVIPVLQQHKCKQLYGSVITSNMFCAGMTGRSPCNGDSGGPVVYRNQQIGIVSFGEGCGTYFTGVYTNVGEFGVWIMRESGVKFV
jgi:trypsin